MGVYNDTGDPNAIIEEDSDIMSSTIQDVTGSAITSNYGSETESIMENYGQETILDTELEPDMPKYQKGQYANHRKVQVVADYNDKGTVTYD